MKQDRQDQGRRSRPAPQQQRYDRQIEQQSAVSHEVDDRLAGQQRRLRASLLEPQANRFAREPVSIELGQAAVEIDQADLDLQQSQRPARNGRCASLGSAKSVERSDAVCGNQRHQEANQA